MSTYLQYNNHMILHPTDSSKYFYGIEEDPLNPLSLPPYTIRLLYKDGVTPRFIKGKAFQLSSSPNVWDLNYLHSDWSGILEGIFNGVENVHRYNLLKVLGANTSGVTNMTRMLENCAVLNEVAIFDTSAVTTTERMFEDTISITSVPNFDTRNVTNFRSMFQQSGIINVPALDTSNATDVSRMFYECNSLRTIPLMDTSNVTTMESMFWHCDNLITVPQLDSRSVTDMSYMFYSCPALTTVPLLNTGSVTDFSAMFYNCTSLTSIPLFNTVSAINMNNMFYNCTNVSSGALALYQQASTHQVAYMNHYDTFYQCGSNTQTGAAELDQIPTTWGGNKSVVIPEVTIGSQTWMSKNLAIDDGQGGIYTQTVNYGQGDVTEYYYTWNAAVRIANSISGWHLPTQTEFETLNSTVGSNDSGTKLKSTYGWSSGNGTDDYGFSVFPAGQCYTPYSSYDYLGTQAKFWSATDMSWATTHAWYFKFDTGATMVLDYTNKANYAFSVRLVKDS